MQTIAQQVLSPLATPQTPGAFFKGLRLVSLDGSGLEVADEAANRAAFGVPGTKQGRTGYPQLRFVALLENATGDPTRPSQPTNQGLLATQRG